MSLCVTVHRCASLCGVVHCCMSLYVLRLRLQRFGPDLRRSPNRGICWYTAISPAKEMPLTPSSGHICGTPQGTPQIFQVRQADGPGLGESGTSTSLCVVVCGCDVIVVHHVRHCDVVVRRLCGWVVHARAQPTITRGSLVTITLLPSINIPITVVSMGVLNTFNLACMGQHPSPLAWFPS